MEANELQLKAAKLKILFSSLLARANEEHKLVNEETASTSSRNTAAFSVVEPAGEDSARIVELECLVQKLEQNKSESEQHVLRLKQEVADHRARNEALTKELGICKKSLETACNEKAHSESRMQHLSSLFDMLQQQQGKLREHLKLAENAHTVLQDEHGSLLTANESLTELTTRQHTEIGQLAEALKRSQQKLAECSQLYEIKSIDCMRLEQQLKHLQDACDAERQKTEEARNKQTNLIEECHSTASTIASISQAVKEGHNARTQLGQEVEKLRTEYRSLLGRYKGEVAARDAEIQQLQERVREAQQQLELHKKSAATNKSVPSTPSAKEPREVEQDNSISSTTSSGEAEVKVESGTERVVVTPQKDTTSKRDDKPTSVSPSLKKPKIEATPQDHQEKQEEDLLDTDAQTTLATANLAHDTAVHDTAPAGSIHLQNVTQLEVPPVQQTSLSAPGHAYAIPPVPVSDQCALCHQPAYGLMITCKKCRGECHSACVRGRVPGFAMEDSKRFLCDGCKAGGCTAMTSPSENNNNNN